MTALRPCWPRTCLRQLSPLRTIAPDPPLRCRTGAVERRRPRTTLAGDPELFKPVARPQPLEPSQQDASLLSRHLENPTGCPLLDCVVDAGQRRDVAATREAFLAWRHVLADESSPQRPRAIESFENLPTSTLSEILRSIDPLRHPELDVSHGLRLTMGHTRFMPSGELIDEYGVRNCHYQIMEGVQTILGLREQSQSPLRAADFDAILRIAGVTQDWRIPPIFFGSMKDHDLREARTTQTWAEFLKARFMVEPSYFQYDRARVNVTPQDLAQSNMLFPEGQVHDSLMRMERHRMSVAALKREPWNRRRDDASEDIKRLLRRSKDGEHKTFWSHFMRTVCYPHNLDEELVSICLVALSRSNQRDVIFTMLLKPYYGITVDSKDHTVEVDEEHDIPEDSPLRPTPRLIYALVEAFGTMAELSLGLQLADVVSRRYNVALGPQVWSNILQWTYVSSSKVFKPLWKFLNNDNWEHLRPVSWRHVLDIWKIMTSPPYNIVPTFEDLDVLVKTLIASKNFKPAVEHIRSTAMPFYQKVDQEYQDALLEEILFNDAKTQQSPAGSAGDASSSQHHTQRRKVAEVRKDFVFNRIALWFDALQREASKSRPHRNGDMMQRLIPDLIGDFPEFFQRGAWYRPSLGRVRINVQDDYKARWDPSFFAKSGSPKTQYRYMLPEKVASVRVAPNYQDQEENMRRKIDEETGMEVENPDFIWPTIPEEPRVVEEKLPTPRRRPEFGRPPDPDKDPDGAREWWAALEEEMVL